MQVQRPRPWNSKLPEPAISGCAAAASPLERNLESPKGWKKREPDCIGLAIVAALEKAGSDAEAKAKARLVVGASSWLHASAPIAIAVNPRTATKAGVFSEDSSDVGCTGRCADHGGGGGFFCVSPPAWGDESPAAYRMADFLSHCNLCRKRLHGKDIYMYRGDKAFCSIECRYQQIVSDESSFKKEKCWSEASKKPSDAAAAASPYSGGGRFFFITGIAAA